MILSSSLLLLVILVTLQVPEPTHGAVVTTINTKAFRRFIQDVRRQVLPDFISIINRVADRDLTVSTEVGTCCGAGDTGAKATVSLSNLQINNQTLDDPVLTMGNSNSDVATLTFTTRNIDLQSKVTSSIAVSAGLGGSGLQCKPALRIFLKMPVLSFNVNLVRSTIQTGQQLEIGAASFQASMNALQIDPVSLFISVVDDSSGLCDNVLDPITKVINKAASLLIERVTNTFKTQISNYMSDFLIDTIPVAFDLPVPMENGNFHVGLGIQSLQTTSNGLVSIIGSSFGSTITNVEWRNGYYYNRALADTASVLTDKATGLSLLNQNLQQLIQMRVTYPPINNFFAAIHHQVWAGLATDASVVDNMEDFCSLPEATDDTTDDEVNFIAIDPCPFPPIRESPSTIGAIALKVFYLGYTNFKYQTAIQPPVMDIVSTSSNISDIVLRGRVPSKVALRGTSTGRSGIFQSLLFGGSDAANAATGESTIALLDVDVVFEISLPSYNRDTDRIEWDDNGLSIRIENAVSETRFPIFANLFVNFATSFINQFITRRLLTPINNGIRFGLDQIPIRIPSIRNLPLRNANIDFDFPNFVMNFDKSDGMTVASDFSIDVTYPAAAVASVQGEDEEDDTTTATIVALAQDVFTQTVDDTIIVYTSVYEEGNDDFAVTSRVTSSDDSTVTVEQYEPVNQAWVPVAV